MELMVDLNTGEVSLHGAEDFGRFAVRVSTAHKDDGEGTGAAGALAAALSVHHAGRLDHEGHAFIPPDAVRRLAGASGTVIDPGWEAALASMIEYASTKGWIADDGAIQAHVEWGDA